MASAPKRKPKAIYATSLRSGHNEIRQRSNDDGLVQLAVARRAFRLRRLRRRHDHSRRVLYGAPPNLGKSLGRPAAAMDASTGAGNPLYWLFGSTHRPHADA